MNRYGKIGTEVMIADFRLPIFDIRCARPDKIDNVILRNNKSEIKNR